MLNNGDTINYALGLTVDEYRGLNRVQHGGAWAGFRAMLARYPDQHTSVIVECNRGDASVGAYANRVADAVLAGEFTESATDAEQEEPTPPEERVPVQLATDQLARWEGVFVSDEDPQVLVFEVRESRLVVLVEGETFPLRAYSETDFEVLGVGIQLAFADEDGAITATGLGNTYERLDRTEPSANELRAYVGSYWSAEIDATYEVTLDGTTLMLQRPGRDPAGLIALAADEFSGAGLGITFVRDLGRVTGLKVDAGRVTGIVFEREGN